MGADKAIHLTADEVPVDGFAIAQALATALRDGGYDLILFGRHATDTGHGTVGPMVAQMLGLPCVTAITHLEINNGLGTAQRAVEGATETVTFPLPAVLSIDEGLGRPRIPSLKGIMAAKKKPLDEQPAQLGPISLTLESLAPPPERPAGRIVGEGAAAVPELVRLLREEAKVLGWLTYSFSPRRVAARSGRARSKRSRPLGRLLMRSAANSMRWSPARRESVRSPNRSASTARMSS